MSTLPAGAPGPIRASPMFGPLLAVSIAVHALAVAGLLRDPPWARGAGGGSALEVSLLRSPAAPAAGTEASPAPAVPPQLAGTGTRAEPTKTRAPAEPAPAASEERATAITRDVSEPETGHASPDTPGAEQQAPALQSGPPEPPAEAPSRKRRVAVPAPETVPDPASSPVSGRPESAARTDPPGPSAKAVATQPAIAAEPTPARSGTTTRTAPPPPAPAAESREPPAPGGEEAASGGDAIAHQPARIGGAGLNNPAPRYPYAARQRGQEGRVVLAVRVARDGSALEVRVAESSGHRLLDQAALEAVQGWRFEPAQEAARTVESELLVPVTFRLR